jgi:phosphate transport system substrate-binding protein
MNDDFLHRIRTDPPPHFLARLKSRLDLQHEKSIGPSRRQWLRNAFLLTLLGASGLAAALILTNIYRQENTSPTPSASGVLEAAEPGNTSAPVTPHVAGPTSASPPQVESRAAGSFRMAGPSLFRPTVQDSVRVLKRNGAFTEPDYDTKDSTAAVAALCSGGTHVVDAVVLTRRILAGELKDCGAHGIKRVAEVKLGYQAIVFARSNLYPAPTLTQRDIVLALAREIPDPANPRRLIKNPNIRWGQVNSAFLDEAIDIPGPSANTTAVTAAREIVLDTCAASLSPGSIKDADKSRLDDGCKSIRADGVYHEVPADLEGYLEAHPEALALVGYKYFAVYRGQLVGASIDGVAPSEATLSDGSYPASHTLYLYVNASRADSIPRMREFSAALVESVAMTPGTVLMTLNETDRRASRTAAYTLPDLTL